MGTVNIITLMVIYMMVNFYLINKLEKLYLLIKMATNMLVVIKMDIGMDMEKLSLQVVIFMKGSCKIV